MEAEPSRFTELEEVKGNDTQSLSKGVEFLEEDSKDMEKEMELVRDLKKASSMKGEGNILFKAGNFNEACKKYTMALKLCPLNEESNASRAVFLNNRAACFLHLNQLDDALEDCNASILANPDYIKAYLRRSKIFEEKEMYDEALQDIESILKIDKTVKPAIDGKLRLEKIIKENQEKMKAEMMGKLKSFGNTILGKFGMSTDNFNMVQDPNTGSYSINYKPSDAPTN